MAVENVDESTITNADKKAAENHEIDSLSLLMYLWLLILTVLTIWLFKHRRLRFVHETGLAIIYGLIVGVIIRYTSHEGHVPPVISYAANDNETVPRTFYIEIRNDCHQYDYVRHVKSEINLNQNFLLEEKATFNPEVFFNVLLPPIIFSAGYSMKRKHFFKNFGAIMTYAFLGTMLSCLAVGGLMYGVVLLMPDFKMHFSDCLLFGAIISATDPVTVLAIFNDLNVDVDLYALVFGESVLNDAVALILVRTIDSYAESSTVSNASGYNYPLRDAFGNFLLVFFGSFALGSFIGCLTAVITKFTAIRDFPLLETSLFFMMSYSAFLSAEAASLTGIVSVLFCGISQAHYTYNNLSEQSKLRTKELFELLHFLMENFIFTYIGVSIFTFNMHKWKPVFIICSFVAILVARAVNIYPLSYLLNLGRSNKIRPNLQHMMVFSGLRGAVAFALAIQKTETFPRQVMFSTTLVIVCVTVIINGGMTTPMLQWLKIDVGVDDEEHQQELQRIERRSTLPNRRYRSMEDSSGTDSISPTDALPHRLAGGNRSSEKAWLVLKWYNIDGKFIKPLLTHAVPTLMETMPSCCRPIANLLTSDQQREASGSTHQQLEDSDADLIIDDELNFQNPTENQQSPPNEVSLHVSQSRVSTRIQADNVDAQQV